VDWHCFDADPDPETIVHFDANPNPDPTFHFDANPDPTIPRLLHTGMLKNSEQIFEFIHGSASLPCFILFVQRHRCHKFSIFLTKY
jgi:hypothetical protein